MKVGIGRRKHVEKNNDRVKGIKLYMSLCSTIIRWTFAWNGLFFLCVNETFFDAVECFC